MAVTLSYGAALARVRVAAQPGVLNDGGDFETGVAGYVGVNADPPVRSTVQAHHGVASALVTPSGTGVVARVEGSVATGVPVVAGQSITVSAWVRLTTASKPAVVQISWRDAGGAFLSSTVVSGTSTAGVWQALTVTGAAPAGAATACPGAGIGATPTAVDTAHVDELTIATAAGIVWAGIERSTDGVRWTTVRGAARLTPSAGRGEVAADDYEFPPGVPVTYRVRGYTAVDVLVSTETAVITAVIDRVWLKSVARPYLNTAVVAVDYSPVSRKSRAGVFAVSGRTLPVVVSSVRGSREWSLQVRTDSPAAARGLDLLLAGGDIVYVQVPPGFDIPGGYVSVGDAGQSRVSRTLADVRRLFELPMLEVAAPGPDVVGYAATWAGLLADFGSWTALAAAFPSWAAAAEYVADPETVIVP